MKDQFKESNYVKIVQDIIPELHSNKNPLDLGKIKEFPNLKNIVLISDKKVHGMINFKDLYSLYNSSDELEMIEREKHINFEDATNI